jgi:hypothetical protein
LKYVYQREKHTMKLHCEIATYNQEAGEMRTAGIVTLEGGTISAKVEPGRESVMEYVMGYTCIVDGGRNGITAAGDPEKWIRALPSNFGGTYMGAGMIEEAEPKAEEETTAE